MPTQQSVKQELAKSQLDMAEQVDPDLLFDYGRFLKRNSLLGGYEFAWNSLEIGLAAESSSYLDIAFDTFHRLQHNVSDQPRVNLCAGIDVAIAYEQAFRKRATRTSISRKAINETFRKTAKILEATIARPGPIKDYKGGVMGELLFLNINLYNRDLAALPFPASPREENNRKVLNHDSYLLDASTYSHKRAVQVKLSELDDSYHPAIKVIRIAPIINEALEPYETELIRSRQYKRAHTAAQRKDRNIAYVANLLVMIRKRSRHEVSVA